VGRENMPWRKKGSWAAVNKERGELGENQHTASFGYKTTFQFTNIFFNLQII
jgi:hypothetical protein